MAKQNVYAALDFDVIKEEMGGIMRYLQSLTIEKLTDDVKWVGTPTGGIAPRVVSSIENKMSTAITTLYDFVSQLEIIYKSEGVSEFLLENIDNIRAKMNEIQDYYLTREPLDMDHRYIEVESKKKTISFLAATAEQQIKTRSDILKKTLQILPKLSQLESVKKEFNQRGGGDTPPSLIGII